MLALCSSLQEDMRPSQCQTLCSENEIFVNNINPCNTCEKRKACALDTVGGPGCDCLTGFYKNNDGKCVPEEECEGNKILCRKDEVFLECSCERTCCNGGRFVGCSASCKKGCFCKKGLVRHEDGRCIRLKDCKKENGENSPGPGSPPVQCSIPKCDDDCSIDYSTKPCPTLPSPTNCKPDEQYYECIPICHGTCSAYLTKSYMYCKMACRSGCFCREGLYKTDDGRCVPASQCTAPNSPENACGENAEYRECGSACPPTCADSGRKNKVCTKQCVSGCFCKKGFVKNDRGVCVRPKECQQGPPPVQCLPPKCAPGCSIDYSTKPCPSCSCT
ncbi:hypothetical protein AVEN_113762-1, partial [Araneus ventricosus]